MSKPDRRTSRQQRHPVNVWDLVDWDPPLEQTRAMVPQRAEDDGSVRYFDDTINVDADAEGSLEASGRRPDGIGTENVRQGLVSAEMMWGRGGESGRECGVVLRVTLLAAGFVVGPNGAAIHQIEAFTETQIRSFNSNRGARVVRPTRQFQIGGSSSQVQHAVDIICHAIQLYKGLTEGNHRNMMVKRLHKLDGVLFRYEPPPKARVPFAAEVMYEMAELRAINSRRSRRWGQGGRSAQDIREVRRLLAVRDEAIMRSNIPLDVRPLDVRPLAPAGVLAPAPGPSRFYRPELGQPCIQNHGYERDRRQQEGEGSRDAAHMATISSPLIPASVNLDLRPHRQVVGFFASEEDEDPQPLSRYNDQGSFEARPCCCMKSLYGIDVSIKTSDSESE